MTLISLSERLDADSALVCGISMRLTCQPSGLMVMMAMVMG